MVKKDVIRSMIIEAIENNKSVAPREIAQSLTVRGENWQKLLPVIRAVAVELESDNLLTFLRRNKPVPSNGLKGVYRLAKRVVC